MRSDIKFSSPIPYIATQYFILTIFPLISDIKFSSLIPNISSMRGKHNFVFLKKISPGWFSSLFVLSVYSLVSQKITMSFEKRELVKHLYPSTPTSNKHFMSLFATKSNNMVMPNDCKLKKVLIIRQILL